MDNDLIFGKIHVTQTRYTWTIEEPQKIFDNGEEIYSPTFETLINGDNIKWRLSLALDDLEDPEEKDQIGIYIECIDRSDVTATVDFSIIDSDNEEIPYETLENNTFDSPWGEGYFMKKEDLKSANYVVNGKLRIVCNITTNERIAIEQKKRKEEKTHERKLAEFEHFGNLFGNEKYSDVVFSINGKNIKAHKNVLSIRSKIFETMLTNETLESKGKIIEIKDMEYDTFHALLRYIYTAEVNFQCEPEKLLTAADNYCFESLKFICEEKLSEDIEIDNVFDRLKLAELHNATYLREKAIEYIVDNAKDVVKSSVFKAHNNLHPDVTSELFRALALKD